MQRFEHTLGYVASRCEINYSGAVGAVGYLYLSAKDQLKYAKLSQKKYIHLIMGIGRYMVMSDEDFAKSSIGAREQSVDDMSAMLIAAFGDGK